MKPRNRKRFACAAWLALAAPCAAAAQDPLTVAEARASMVGRWEGVHESLDAGAASEAFNWPVAVEIEDAGDGSTHIERVQFAEMDDDGALQVTVTLLDADGVTEHGSLYSRGSAPEHRSVTLALAAARDETHWTLNGVGNYERDGGTMEVRYLIVRDGATLVSTFELDPPGEEPPFGQTRRTLRRVDDGR